MSRSLIILDDFFPNLATAFRVAEYNYYLQHFRDSKVLSTHKDFDSSLKQYATLYPDYAQRINPYSDNCLSPRTLAYTTFLNNAYAFLPIIEDRQIPLILNLYPGGGFSLFDKESDTKLSRVLSSKSLRTIITTQQITTKYIEKFSTRASVIEIFGVCVNPIYLTEPTRRTRTTQNTPRRVCFAAARYMQTGANKGFPEFIEIASSLATQHPDLEFNVVGGHTINDISIPRNLDNRISFAGPLETNSFRDFLSQQDVIVSPNKPFVINKGNFDGFPTGCCVEASLCGVAMFVSDPLNLNSHYTAGHDLVLCEPNAYSFIDNLSYYLDRPEQIRAIGNNGRDRSLELFSIERQLISRTKAIERHL